MCKIPMLISGRTRSIDQTLLEVLLNVQSSNTNQQSYVTDYPKTASKLHDLYFLSYVLQSLTNSANVRCTL